MNGIFPWYYMYEKELGIAQGGIVYILATKQSFVEFLDHKKPKTLVFKFADVFFQETTRQT